MKIAVASDRGSVSEHFGHCEGFEIFTVQDGTVSKGEFVKNPGHRPGFLPEFLHDLGVNTIIAGGMGKGAIDIFNHRGIGVITGASGKCTDVAEKYTKGNLETSESTCEH